jgi:hypothetical protein
MHRSRSLALQQWHSASQNTSAAAGSPLRRPRGCSLLEDRFAKAQLRHDAGETSTASLRTIGGVWRAESLALRSRKPELLSLPARSRTVSGSFNALLGAVCGVGAFICCGPICCRLLRVYSPACRVITAASVLLLREQFNAVAVMRWGRKQQRSRSLAGRRRSVCSRISEAKQGNSERGCRYQRWRWWGRGRW